MPFSLIPPTKSVQNPPQLLTHSKMAKPEPETTIVEEGEKLSTFTNTGIYPLSKTIFFIDPVRFLNRSYTRFKVSPSSYYTRFFQPKLDPSQTLAVSVNSRKRKRKEKKPHHLNERERSADLRHQEARGLLVRAHEALLGEKGLVSILCDLNRVSSSSSSSSSEVSTSGERDDGDGPSFVELGRVWQAPLYEISLRGRSGMEEFEDGGQGVIHYDESKAFPLFNNLVTNDSSADAEADFLEKCYIIPRKSCFHMSNLEQLHDLIPANPGHGFNLIVIDPPWENGSACQKSMYPTLPNRYFLSLPIKQLTHRNGALVALWVTNREKLRVFIEKELFPMWGVSYSALIYWLKVKPDGSLIGELDLFHHRPYECLLLGYSHGEGMDSKHLSTFIPLRENQVIVSIPGDYSRKPPVGELLLNYVPGPKLARCIELFARELLAGWTSWGNEPLHFQDSRYFLYKEEMNSG